MPQEQQMPSLRTVTLDEALRVAINVMHEISTGERHNPIADQLAKAIAAIYFELKLRAAAGDAVASDAVQQFDHWRATVPSKPPALPLDAAEMPAGAMTRQAVLKRLDEIGMRFVRTGIEDDPKAYRERGIALGVAVGLVGTLSDEYLNAAIRAVEESAEGKSHSRSVREPGRKPQKT